jgi:nitroreductase
MTTTVTPDVLQALMAQRRSVRRFKPAVPPKAAIEALIAAAVTAPSASNKQPWRFCVLTDRGLIEHLRAAVQATLDAVLARLGDDEFARGEIEAYGRYFVRFVDAPVVIVPMCRPLAVLSQLLGVESPDTPDPSDELCARVAAMEQRSSLVSTSLAIQNLLLAAHAQGLGASCMSGPLLAAPEIATSLALGADWEPVCLVALGYADEEPVAPVRKSAETVTRWYGDAP